jgi:hypothetical protein
MLNVLVAEVGLQGAGVVPVIRQLIAAGVAQHVRMRLEAQLGLDASALDHAGEPGRTERRAALGREHEGRLGLLLAPEPPQSAQFVAKDRMGAGSALFDPADVQGSRPELDLVPAQVLSNLAKSLRFFRELSSQPGQLRKNLTLASQPPCNYYDYFL